MTDPPIARTAGAGRVARRAWLRRRLPAGRRVPPVLTLILIVAAVQSLAWDIALPAFQGPDEDAHFAYVQHLAETGSVPDPYQGASPYSAEQADAMNNLNLFALMGDLYARPADSPADLAQWHVIERHLPQGARANGSGANPIAKNPPLYYALMAIPYRAFVWLPLLKRLFILRLFNALCYLATIALTWMLAGDLFGRIRWKQALAAGAVAFEPQLAFTSAIINADSLLITLTTAVLVAAVRLVIRGPSIRRVAIAAALCAAAILTHGRGLVTVPVLAVALAVAWLRHRPPLRDGARQAAIALGGVIAGLGIDYVIATGSGGGALYGGQVKSLNTGQFSLGAFASYTYQFFFGRLASMTPRIGPDVGYRQVFVQTFYGTFGWLEINFPSAVYGALQVGSALGLVGLYTACVVKWRTLRRHWAPVIVMLALAVTQITFLMYVAYQALIADGGSDPLIVGRYLLPIVALFAVAIVFTIGSLPRRLAIGLGTCVLSGAVLLSLAGIGITAARFYA